MITGTHILLYSDNAEADRAFFRDVLGFPCVDAGHGWLIFKLPVAETGIHPSEGGHGKGLLAAELYLMCDDLRAQVQALAARNVQCTKIEEAPWGIKTSILLPSGGAIGLYQPRHPTALGL
jgi:catechol 2,3-dioxygenase-like lactoylglutathione lyase family enzyme